jgi:hypothetical protein
MLKHLMVQVYGPSHNEYSVCEALLNLMITNDALDHLLYPFIQMA